MTRAELLRHRADEVDDEADQIRWSNPTSARHLQRVARDLRTIAANLPPERGQQ